MGCAGSKAKDEPGPSQSPEPGADKEVSTEAEGGQRQEGSSSAAGSSLGCTSSGAGGSRGAGVEPAEVPDQPAAAEISGQDTSAPDLHRADARAADATRAPSESGAATSAATDGTGAEAATAASTASTVTDNAEPVSDSYGGAAAGGVSVADAAPTVEPGESNTSSSAPGADVGVEASESNASSDAEADADGSEAPVAVVAAAVGETGSERQLRLEDEGEAARRQAFLANEEERRLAEAESDSVGGFEVGGEFNWGDGDSLRVDSAKREKSSGTCAQLAEGVAVISILQQCPDAARMPKTSPDDTRMVKCCSL